MSCDLRWYCARAVDVVALTCWTAVGICFGAQTPYQSLGTTASFRLWSCMPSAKCRQLAISAADDAGVFSRIAQLKDLDSHNGFKVHFLSLSVFALPRIHLKVGPIVPSTVCSEIPPIKRSTSLQLRYTLLSLSTI